MGSLHSSGTIGEFKQKIKKIRSDLEELDNQKPLPELINSTNLLRVNEFLTKSDAKKSELLTVYDEYSKQLENLVSLVFEIQNELKDILRDQSALITTKSKTSENTQTKKKTKKKLTQK